MKINNLKKDFSCTRFCRFSRSFSENKRKQILGFFHGDEKGVQIEPDSDTNYRSKDKKQISGRMETILITTQ